MRREEKLAISQRLKHLRRRLRLTQEGLGRFLGYSSKIVSDVELEKRPPSSRFAARLAEMERATLVDRAGTVHVPGRGYFHSPPADGIFAQPGETAAPPAAAPPAAAPPGIQLRPGGRIPSSGDAPQYWHRLLDEVLHSGNEEAIRAVQSNLYVFARYVRRPGARFRP